MEYYTNEYESRKRQNVPQDYDPKHVYVYKAYINNLKKMMANRVTEEFKPFLDEQEPKMSSPKKRRQR